MDHTRILASRISMAEAISYKDAIKTCTERFTVSEWPIHASSC